MEREHILRDSLAQPASAITYAITRRIKSLFPDQYVLHTDTGTFDLDHFVYAGKAVRRISAEATPQIDTNYYHQRPAAPIYYSEVMIWYEIEWEGRQFELLIVTLQEGYGKNEYKWLVADTRAEAESLFVAVCAYNSEVRSEILVYDHGCWQKSQPLFEAIQASEFDNLILPPRLKQSIQTDFVQFLAAKDTYHRYKLPWKRGALLTGPPGNGKTHTVKALINQLGIPCLYVKSFDARHGTPQICIHEVFEKARQTTPCIMVLEDLDSLIDDKTRSFFLNEMDGFDENDGIIILATTNHPDRLDPALVERPSRFDRKYVFELPAYDEREAYIAMWNSKLEPELKLAQQDIETIARQTDAFSFAYLKELFLSSMMQWISGGAKDGMDAVMREQVVALRSQMTNMSEERPELLMVDGAGDDEYDPYGED